MLHPSWMSILLASFAFVLLCNGLMASLWPSFYKNVPTGRLSHSQLRIKQGNATVEQRFNVFVVSLLFGVAKLRNLLFTLVLAAAVNFIFLWPIA